MAREGEPTLLGMILGDLWGHKVAIGLYLLVVSSAMALVFTTHQTRMQIAKQDELMAARDLLNIEWRHLKIESDTLTEHSRVQYIAEHELNMVVPDEKSEKVVRLP